MVREKHVGPASIERMSSCYGIIYQYRQLEVVPEFVKVRQDWTIKLLFLQLAYCVGLLRNSRNQASRISVSRVVIKF
jgi:hypothetical protein